MSITLVYDGTTADLSGANVPDSPIGIGLLTVGGIRRTYLGTAKIWSRWAKHYVEMTWTGISSTVVGTLEPLSSTTETIYGTGFDTNVFTTQYVNFKVQQSSWTVQPTGLNSYTVKLRFEEL